MKKLIGLIIFASSFFNVSAQIKRNTLLEKKIGPINLEYTKIVDIDRNNTRYMVSLTFQNEEYKSIIDVKVIGFFDSTKLNEFIQDLNSAFKQMELNEKVDMTWGKKDYNLQLYTFSKDLYLYSVNSVPGKTILNTKKVSSLSTALSKIQYGKDEILPY